jgi:hypothetical protein
MFSIGSTSRGDRQISGSKPLSSQKVKPGAPVSQFEIDHIAPLHLRCNVRKTSLIDVMFPSWPGLSRP